MKRWQIGLSLINCLGLALGQSLMKRAAMTNVPLDAALGHSPGDRPVESMCVYGWRDRGALSPKNVIKARRYAAGAIAS